MKKTKEFHGLQSIFCGLNRKTFFALFVVFLYCSVSYSKTAVFKNDNVLVCSNKVSSTKVVVLNLIEQNEQEQDTTKQGLDNTVYQETDGGVSNSEVLEDVVVVGYTTQKKADITGAVASIKMSSIKDMATSGVVSSLQGRMPGVTVLQNSGTPGSGASIRIRGVGTVGNSEPLYIIDGMPANNMNDINPGDIERIDVLKDAASAAIYGSRAANGVVLIQTKKGAGKTSVTFNTYYGMSSATNLRTLLNAEQRNMIHKEAYANDGNSADASPYYDSEYAQVTRTNWLDKVFTTNAAIKNYEVGIAGSSNNSRYNISLSHLNQEGILTNSGYTRSNVRINTETDIVKNLKFGENLMLSSSDQFAPREYGSSGAISGAYVFDPAVPVYDEEKGGYSGAGALQTDYRNPMRTIEKDDRHNYRKSVFGNMYAEWTFLNDFKLKTDLGLDWSRANRKEFFGKVPEAARPTDVNSLEEGYSESTRLMSTTTLRWEKTLDVHHIALLGGTSFEDYDEIYGTTVYRGFPDEDPSQRYVDMATEAYSYTGLRTQWALQSFFGRADYDFKGKYLFSASVRADGSSKFAKENRWGYFPSVSGGWKISEESFFEGLKSSIQNFKLRASWGTLGNQNIFSNYPTKPIIGVDGQEVAFGTGETLYKNRYEANIPNPKLKWETSTQTNIGIDMIFLKNFDLTFDYFTKNTSDILLEVPIPYNTGLSNAWVNAATIKNTGFEANLNYRTKIGEVDVNVYGNFSRVTNEVTGTGDMTQPMYLSGYQGNITRTIKGQPMSHFWGYKTAGLFKNESELESYVNAAGEKIQPNAQVGDIKYVDLDGNGEINSKDKTNLGDGFPDFTYGFGTQLGYKGLDFSFFFQGVSGYDVMNVTEYEGMFAKAMYNQFADILDRYHPVNNPGGTLPRVTIEDPNANRDNFSDYYVEDASYLRLKNVTLGYTFTKDLLKYISKARIYVNLQNYLTFTKYKGNDPEFGQGNGGSNGYEYGVDRGQMPQPKTWTVGLNINF